MCKIVSYAVPEGPPYYANGPYRAVTKCEEHGMDMGSYFTQLPDQPALCPVGKIEKATEEALAKIAAASS
jgi:hypothetical protein